MLLRMQREYQRMLLGVAGRHREHERQYPGGLAAPAAQRIDAKPSSIVSRSGQTRHHRTAELNRPPGQAQRIDYQARGRR
ncbi:hypothetical protein [Salinicola tamaricis]|uniref:hypothetical protein n=1 Tax=Salinicola tamaricis TaxID=1771309 RepID=UPI000D0A8035|nr:hypothetical protein [Salinicola tamaricis]